MLMISMTRFASLCVFIALASPQLVVAQGSKEEEYYKLIRFPIPEYMSLEAGGLEWMPDGKLAISTRRGDIFLLDQPLTNDPEQATFTKYAGGLHEVLGLSWKDGWLYATQRGEVTKIKDEDNDGRGDLFQTVSDGWEINGDYHEYAFGSKFDKEGNLWVVLCLTGSFDSNNKYRGWCLRITPDGKLIPTCSGIRSPGGIGMNAAGDMFYTDNQGPWNGACSLKHLRPGKFVGHPGGNKWYDITGGIIGKRPEDPKSGSRMMVEAKRIPELEPPAVYFPYNKMGQSAAGIAADVSGGKFGPFKDQLFVGDQTHSTVMRVYLEKVKDHYQGACFPFRAGIGSGSLSLIFNKDGSLFVGGTNRGWGSRGTQPHSLDRIVWSGKTPFEILQMNAKHNGFELTFTEKVDAATAGNPKSYKLSTYTYIYQAAYGSPEVDQTTPEITKVEVSADGLKARLIVNGLQEGHVHELQSFGVKSAAGQGLLHDMAYYTLNYIPDAP
jgi:glucose/arabinose dehydrogenase